MKKTLAWHSSAFAAAFSPAFLLVIVGIIVIEPPAYTYRPFFVNFHMCAFVILTIALNLNHKPCDKPSYGKRPDHT